MFFCETNFVGGALACALTPTSTRNIDYVELKKGTYDDLYITKASDFTITNVFPEEWDFDTILWSKFNGNANAGNVDWNLDNVSHLILKSRRKLQMENTCHKGSCVYGRFYNQLSGLLNRFRTNSRICCCSCVIWT